MKKTMPGMQAYYSYFLRRFVFLVVWPAVSVEKLQAVPQREEMTTCPEL
jgi:hypothetical protein